VISVKRRLIEVIFSVKEVSEIASKERNIRHGHISTLHTGCFKNNERKYRK